MISGKKWKYETRSQHIQQYVGESQMVQSRSPETNYDPSERLKGPANHMFFLINKDQPIICTIYLRRKMGIIPLTQKNVSKKKKKKHHTLYCGRSFKINFSIHSCSSSLDPKNRRRAVLYCTMLTSAIESCHSRIIPNEREQKMYRN